MSLIKNPGRRTGLWYLLAFGAPLRLAYIPAKLFVPGDAAATANNLMTHETLFRLGMFVELYHGIAMIFLTPCLVRSTEASQSETCGAGRDSRRRAASGN